jgi:hypothetical protein
MCFTRAIKANYIQGQNNSTINILLNTEDINIFSFGLFLPAEVFLSHSGFLDHIQLTHTVGLLWTSDQPVAEASTYTGQHNI